jgi:hypothetical protein
MKLQLEIDVTQTGSGLTATITGVKQLEAAAGGAAVGMGGLTAANRAAGMSFKGLAEDAVLAAGAMITLAAAYRTATELASLVMEGVKFTSMLQQQELGTRALYATFTRMTDARGKDLDMMERYHAAQGIAIELQTKLKVAALATTLVYSDLMMVMAGAMPYMLQKLPTNVISDAGKMANLVAQFSQGAQVFSNSSYAPGEIATNLRLALSGGGTNRIGRFAKALESDLGEDPKVVKEKIAALSEQGKLYDYLMGRLAAFSAAGKDAMNTYAGALSNLHDAWQQLLGEGTTQTTGVLTQAILALRDDLVIIDAQGKATFNPVLITAISTIATGIGNIATAGVELLGVYEAIANNPFWKWAMRGLSTLSPFSSPFTTEIPGVGTGAKGFRDSNVFSGVANAPKPADAFGGPAGRGLSIMSGKPEDEDSAAMKEQIQLAKDKLAIKKLEATEEYGMTVIQKAEVTYATTLAKIEEEFHKANAAAAKDDKTDKKTAAALRAAAQATDVLEIQKANNVLADAKKKEALLERNETATAHEKIELLRLQGTITYGMSELGKINLEREIKRLEIQDKLNVAIRGIAPGQDPTGNKARDLRAEAAVEQTNADKATGVATTEVMRLNTIKLEDMRLQNAEAKSGLAILARESEIRDIDNRAVISTADIQRKLWLERQNALDKYNDEVNKAAAGTAKTLAEFNLHPTGDAGIDAGIRTAIGQGGLSAADAAAQRYGEASAAINREAQLASEAQYGTMRKQAQQLTEIYDRVFQDIASGAQAAFLDLESGKGFKAALKNLSTNFGRMMADEFGKQVAIGLDAIKRRALGGYTDPRTGQFIQDTTPVSYSLGPDGELVRQGGEPVGASRSAKYAMAGVQGASALYGIYQQSKTSTGSQGSDVASGAIQGASAGASFGVYGMVVGAVVGILAAELAQAKKGGYTISVTGGKIGVTGKNVSDSSVIDAIATINTVIGGMSKGVFAIFDAFPVAIGQTLDTLAQASILKDSMLGVATPGKLSGGPSWAPPGLQKFLVQDTPGGRALHDYVHKMTGTLSGSDLTDFVNVTVPKLFLDAYTPIIKGGLSQLGVTEKKIADLFSVASYKKPAEFFQFITDYVTGFVAMQASVEFLSKSATQKTTIAGGKSLTDQLAEANTQIAYLGQGFADLTSEEQVTRLGQINAAIASRYALELQELAAIAAAKKAVTKSYGDTLFGLALGEAKPSGAIAMLRGQRAMVEASLNDQLSGRLGRQSTIAGAKTPAEVTAIADSYASLTTQIYNFAKTLRDQFLGLLDQFAALDARKAADLDALMPVTGQLGKIVDRTGVLSAGFGALSPEDQISHAQELITLANNYYDIQHKALTDLANAAESVHKSITDQIKGIAFDQLKNDPQAQIEFLLADNRKLYDQLKNASSAQEITDITGRIQSNAGQLYTLQGSTPGAAASTMAMLKAADDAAQARIKQLGIDWKAADDLMRDRLKGIVTDIGASAKTASDIMLQATKDLAAFGVQVQMKLDTFVDAMMTSDAGLLAILQPIFDALGSTAEGTTSALDGATGALGRFSGALDRAAGSLGNNPGFTSGGNSRINITVSGSIAPFVSMVEATVDNALSVSSQNAQRSVSSRAAL